MTEQIRVSESAWKTLNARKDPGDTFADVVDELIDEHDELKYQTEYQDVAEYLADETDNPVSEYKHDNE